jgi:predicted TIM-barrel fold metal-dependent hydrolase
MSLEPIQAIDVHGHYGKYDRGQADLVNEFMTGDAAEVVRRARLAHTELTIVSPLLALLPRGKGDAVAGNEEAARVVEETPGLLQYVVIDPRRPRTYEQADEMLKRPKCAGIKIHPEEHCYRITEHGRAIFAFAAARRAVVLTHSSEQNSLAADFVPLADEFPEVRVILAHIGCGWDGDLAHQVRAIQQSRAGNLFADTSSARSITPGLIEWAVREIGAERVLYGTDTPLYFAPMQRARIDHADLTEAQKRLILRDNALRLFGLPQVAY